MEKQGFCSEQAAQKIVVDALSQYTNTSVSADDFLEDFGLSSLERTELLVQLEDGCDQVLQGILPTLPYNEIDDRAYATATTVNDLMQLVADQLRRLIMLTGAPTSHATASPEAPR